MIWGLSLHGWEEMMRWSLALAGVFALVVGVSTYFVVTLQREEIASNKDEFDKYKVDAAAEVAKSNARSDEANARALEAQLALEKFKQPRLLPEARIPALGEKLRPFAGTRFDAAVIPGDPEAIIFLSHVTAALEAAKWIWVEWNADGSGPLQFTYNFAGKPSVGQIGWFNVLVLVHPDDAPKLSNAAKAIVDVLKEEGFEAAWEVVNNANMTNKGVVHVTFGRKR